MSEPNPHRRPLATFLRPTLPASVDADAGTAPAGSAAADPASDETTGAEATAVADTSTSEDSSEAMTSEATDEPALATTAPADAMAPQPAPEPGAPRFLHAPVARLRTPRWQWSTIAVPAMLLLVQIAVADRARLAADAGTRPAITVLCQVVRCNLPVWHEPAAFTMVSREIRPVPGQPGVLQVVASLRNDARWAQAWPSLRLSLSDADGRLAGSGVFGPTQYLGGSAGVSGVVEPGQSAQIAFQVREPAASTVAFTFEFL